MREAEQGHYESVEAIAAGAAAGAGAGVSAASSPSANVKVNNNGGTLGATTSTAVQSVGAFE